MKPDKVHLCMYGRPSLLFQVAMVACQGGMVQRLHDAPAARPGDERGRSKTMNGSEGKVESLERTVLRVGDHDVELTFDDAKAIQKALVGYLEQSTYEDRDELLKWSGPAFIDGDGKLRIGPWLLGSDGKEMFLRYREPPGKFAGKAHKAFLAKNGETWTVTSLVMERIRVRR